MTALCAPVYVVGDSATGWLRSIVVPWIVVGLPLAGMCLRTMLGQMVEVGDEEFVRAARAKGLSEPAIRRRHIAPAAPAPTAVLASSAMPVLITNVVLGERVFSIDGVFRDLTHSIGTANVPLILDPRVRAGTAAP